MDIEGEVYSLNGEVLALNLVVGNVLRNISYISPQIADAIKLGFEEAASQAELIAISNGPTASPEHTIKAGRIVEGLRAAVFGSQPKPSGVI